MESFATRLSRAITEKKTPLVVGLDPDPAQFPATLIPHQTADPAAAATAILEFNQGVIAAIADLAVAVKPQVAFYERYGWQGMKALAETCAYAREKGLFVILDAKRGDIPNTAAAYALAYLGPDTKSGCSSDALTVNPYLGRDSIQPFLQAAQENGKGVFILARTSNRGAQDLQDLTCGPEGKPLWQEVAAWVRGWAEMGRRSENYSSFGVVAGITSPKEAHHLRQLLPHSFLLLPGFGAQGGKVADALPCFDAEGLGALVAASRSVIYAYAREPYKESFAPEGYASAARQAAQDLLAELRAVGYPLR
ncbi:MAG: orotidine-5'-phosphate decarboxylase [Firmicutes bacterium]|jgi:orotidine-5'-phosphate decarboxylase|nr:orotidine-5'-phosphate decarboxylase [Bacillota bacterium]